jgi:hypothetical protein
MCIHNSIFHMHTQFIMLIHSTCIDSCLLSIAASIVNNDMTEFKAAHSLFKDLDLLTLVGELWVNSCSFLCAGHILPFTLVCSSCGLLS